MANPRLQVDVLAETSKFEAGLKSVESKLKSLQSNLENIGKTMSMALTVPITGFAVASVNAFDKQAQAEGRLRSALEANGRQVNLLFSDYTKFASELQQVTTVGDETTIAMLQVAESMGLTGQSAKDAVRNAIAMESAFGVSTSSAIRMTSALAQGDSQMLTRYIPALRAVEDQAERTALAQNILSNAFGTATTSAEVGLGPLKQLSNNFGDFQERIGKLISGALNPLITKLNSLVLRLQSVDDRTLGLYTGIVLLVGGIGPLVLAFSKLIGMLNLATLKFFAITASIIGLAVGFVYVERNAQAFSDAIIMTFVEVQNAVLTSIENMLTGLAGFIGSVSGITGLFYGAQTALLQFAMGARGLKSDVSSTGAEFQTFEQFTESLKDTFAELFNIVQGLMGEDGALAEGEETITNFMNSITPSLSLVQQLATEFTQGFAQGFADLIIEGGKFKELMQSLGRELAKSGISKLITIALMGGAGGGLGSIFGGLFGAGGGIFGGIGSLIGGAKFTPSTPALTGQNISVGGQFILKGQDLVLAMNRTQDYITR